MPRRARRLLASLMAGLAAPALGLGGFTGCGGEPSAPAAVPPQQAAAERRPEDFIAPGPHPIAVLELEGLGAIRIELLPELAPKTVANFEKLARQGFYDGTYFHRVIPGFMIQGGDPATKNADPRDDGKGGPGYTIVDEFSDYPHVRGTVSMAHAGRPSSGGSQFFIVHQDSPHLDGKYTAFGRVVAGMDVVDAVTELEIDKYGRYGPKDRPYPVDARLVSAHIEPAAPLAAAPAPPAADPAS
jgi:peptidyl-prolyl cis-trans isomerase B (cyclophilin B)